MDKSVLVLGTGYSGLPGLTAAGLGTRQITLTDIAAIIPLLMQKVGENVAFNKVDTLEVRCLVWGEEEEEHDGEDYKHADEDYDVVLISDVFYDMGMMQKLGRTLRRACGETTRALSVTQLRQWTWECLAELEKEGVELVELGEFGCCHELLTG
ncbi:hypothetical protein MLD38_018358 [Melastoma candidum]|uniref:Uncharacterized protein n=1 Tax=Melastoma candidum TaxID=119954 RepID=A0ACB9QUN9_9MYRT|nr:hypothetical protein MLD38_018358 [Melastoma candidum]